MIQLREMLDNLLSPLEAKYHCNVFYVFMVVYLIVIIIGVPLLCYDTYNILSTATKNKGTATAISLLNIIWPLALMILIFYIYRIMYSVCRGSLKGETQVVNEDEEEMLEGPIVDQPMESVI